MGDGRIYWILSSPQAGAPTKDDLKTVTQKTGAILPITSDKRKLEVVKVTAEMKVGRNYQANASMKQLNIL